jgi:hypothetical protein
MAGWEDLKQIFIDAGLPELANVITQLLQDYEATDTNIIYNELRKTQPYQDRFKGNAARLAAGKPVLSEAEYLYNEKMYEETMKAYQAGGLATRDNFATFISNDVSVVELQKRFSAAYTRVTNAVNTNDKPLVDELRKLYPGITDNEIANSLLLGKEGSDYLTGKIDIAEVKAAETETGIQSTLGAGFLASQGIDRSRARVGLSRVAEQKTGIEQASRMFGETSTKDLQKELEQENILGQTSKRTKRLASQARAQYSGQSGIKTGSLGRKAQV